MVTDHRKHDTLDNQESNLRNCTRSENGRNRKKGEGCSSVYKNVSYCKALKKWRVRITFNGKTVNLGRFEKEIDAARAANEGLRKYHGEYALLNTIEEELC